MSPEELFKSMVVYRDKQSLDLLQHMINCNLTVEGLNPNGQPLGGFVAFRGASAKYNHEHMRQASRVITTAWTTRPQVLGYLLGGLTALIHYNDDGDQDTFILVSNMSACDHDDHARTEVKMTILRCH